MRARVAWWLGLGFTYFLAFSPIHISSSREIVNREPSHSDSADPTHRSSDSSSSPPAVRGVPVVIPNL